MVGGGGDERGDAGGGTAPLELTSMSRYLSLFILLQTHLPIHSLLISSQPFGASRATICKNPPIKVD